MIKFYTKTIFWAYKNGWKEKGYMVWRTGGRIYLVRLRSRGETEDELIDQIIEHTKTEHGITIEKGTYVLHILKKLIHLLLLSYTEPKVAHF